MTHTEYLLSLSLTEIRRCRDRIVDALTESYPTLLPEIESVCVQDEAAPESATTLLSGSKVPLAIFDLPAVDSLVRICRHLAARQRASALDLMLAGGNAS